MWVDEHGAAWLEDLGAGGGIWRGGAKVSGPTRIEAGTELELGQRVTLRLVAIGPASP
jgi:hypothetical protein